MEAAQFPDFLLQSYQVTRRHILHHNNHSHPRVHLKSYTNTQVYCTFPTLIFRLASLPEPNGVAVSPDKCILTKYGTTDQIRSLDRTVDILPGLWAGRSRVWIPITARHVSCPKRPERLSGPPNLLFSYSTRTTDSFLGGKAAGDVRLTTHLHPVPRLRISGVTPSFPVHAFVD